MKRINKRTLQFVLTSALVGAAAIAGPGRLIPQAAAWCNMDAEYSSCDNDNGSAGGPEPTSGGGGGPAACQAKLDKYEQLTQEYDAIGCPDIVSKDMDWHYRWVECNNMFYDRLAAKKSYDDCLKGK